MKQVIGIGAGGHAKVVIDILRQIGDYEIMGVLDRDPEKWGTSVLGVPVLNGDDLLPALRKEGLQYAFVGVGAVASTEARQGIFEMLRRYGFHVVSAIHPRAVVASSATVGYGVTLMANAVINPDAVLGDNVVVNTGAVVEHDCILEDHAHVATGASLAGGVFVGEGSHIGSGATVKQGIRIGRKVVVGSGAAVVSDVPDRCTVVGVPARPMKVAITHG